MGLGPRGFSLTPTLEEGGFRPRKFMSLGLCLDTL